MIPSGEAELRLEVVVKVSDDGPLGLELRGDLGEDQADGLEELRGLLKRAVTLVQAPKPGPWLTAKEAADFLRYSRSTFNGLAASGKIPRHKRGAGYRYYEPELTEWLLEG